MNNGTDQKRPTLKQLEELLRFTQGQTAAVVTRYFASATFDEVQSVLKNQKNVGRTFEKLLAPLFANTDPHSASRAYWEKIYWDHYGLIANFRDVVIPEKPVEGKWRLVFILKSLLMNHAAAMYQKAIIVHDSLWGFWKYTDNLDSAVTQNVRTSKESYAIWVRDETEPDKEYLGRSARDADPHQTVGVTLLERLVHGTIHFIEIKKHLDEVGITLCIGSRDADGSVPGVHWFRDFRKVGVNCYPIDFVHPSDGLRQAVCL